MNYTSYKKIYTDGGVFTLDGQEFTGFMEYRDGVARDYETGDELQPVPSYDADLFQTDIFRDRVVDDLDIELPVSRSQCTFGLNETLNYETLKFVFNNIRKNNNYTYSRLFIASNNLPYTTTVSYAAIDNASDTEFTIREVDRNEAIATTVVDWGDTTNFAYLSGVFDTTAQVNYEDSTKFVLFCVSDTSLTSLTGDGSVINVVENSSQYETISGNVIEFGEIGGVTSNKKNLFISDKANNTILKYDITSFVNNDPSIYNKRYLLDILGGDGQVDRRSNLLDPTALACTDDYVAVYDSGNYCIKLYNTDLDYRTTITTFGYKAKSRDRETFGAMAFDPDFGTLYVLNTKDSDGSIVLYRVNVETRKFDVSNLSEELGSNEIIKSISFSQVDSNYWYFNTNKRIFKKYKTRPDSIGVGSYKESNLLNREDVFNSGSGTGGSEDIDNRWGSQNTTWTNTNIIWNLDLGDDEEEEEEEEEETTVAVTDQNIRGFSIVLGSGGNDIQIIVTKSRIFYFNEPTWSAYQKVLRNRNYSNYGISGFSLSPDEYIQVPVINAEIYKLIFDLFVLRDNLIGRFSGTYVDDKVILNNYNYNVDYDALSIVDVEEYFIHHNEENILGAINRVLNNIYDLQEKLIEICNTDVEEQVTECESLNIDE